MPDTSPAPVQFPLQWPPFVPRSQRREAYQNAPTLTAAISNVQTSLRLFGRDSSKAVTAVVISSNVTLGHEKPADPGIAVWFQWEGEWRCIASDRFTTVAGNVQAIHKILEARRTETRYGTLHMVRAAFRGFLALPGGDVIDWRKVMGLGQNPSKTDIDDAFKALSLIHHPDRGGSESSMAQLTQARAAAYAELGLETGS